MNNLFVFSLIVLIVITLGVNIISAHEGDDEAEHHMDDSMMGLYGGFGFMWVFGWLFMILIIVALVLLIIWLVKQIQKPRRKRTR